MMLDKFYYGNSGGVSEPVRILYKLFLVYGAFVAERKINFDGPDRDDYVEELKIKSFDGTYTADMCIRRHIGIITWNISRQTKYEPMFDLHGINHIMRL